jgi:N-dimethylarginine dimethylaminohydrolase
MAKFISRDWQAEENVEQFHQYYDAIVRRGVNVET